MIERTIHYVWLGSKSLPEVSVGYIENWRRLHPTWEIRRWDESNFDCENNEWIRAALANKNYALASDVIRSSVLLNYGGVYLDTDVEILKPLDELVDKNDFFIGYETSLWFGCAILGAKAHHPVMQEVCKRYEVPSTSDNDNSNMLCVFNFSEVLTRLYGINLDGKTRRINDGIQLLQTDYFYPKNYISHQGEITQNTIAIHQYNSVWFSLGKRVGIKVARVARKIMGRHIFGLFERITRVNMLSRLKAEYRARSEKG